jgi:hypothetical protein
MVEGGIANQYERHRPDTYLDRFILMFGGMAVMKLTSLSTASDAGGFETLRGVTLTNPVMDWTIVGTGPPNVHVDNTFSPELLDNPTFVKASFHAWQRHSVLRPPSLNVWR